MQKNLLIIIILLSSYQSAFTQKKFDLTIELDKTIDSKKISCSYYNGKNNIFISDTFTNRVLNLKDKFYSSFVSFHIEYKKNDSASYVNDFFVNEKLARITFQFKPDEQDKVLKYSNIANAVAIYDTNANKIFKQLVRYRRKEALAVSDLWEKHANEIFANDSLLSLNKKLFKALNIRTISFLKNYSQNYFAFWYFRTEVFETSLIFLKNDTSFLKTLIVSARSFFPKKYIESTEGQAIIKRLEGLINPPKVNKAAPLFNIKDIREINIQLDDFKGRYVLLDFWATWCLPCMREIPFLKKIRNEFPAEKLEIIGISEDMDIAKLKEAIVKNTINWIHIFDEGNKIESLFGIITIPTTILINREGVIIYNSGEKEDKEELIRLLKTM